MQLAEIQTFNKNIASELPLRSVQNNTDNIISLLISDHRVKPCQTTFVSKINALSLM